MKIGRHLGMLGVAVSVIYFGFAAYHDLYLNRFCGCGPASETLLTGTPSEEELMAEVLATVPLTKRVFKKNPEHFPWLYRKLYPFPEEYVEVKGNDPALVRSVAGLLQARQSLPVRCLSRGVPQEGSDQGAFVTLYLPRLELLPLHRVSTLP